MQYYVPYTPQQNGVAKRMNRALKEMATCMMEAKDLNNKILNESINCYAYFRIDLQTNHWMENSI